MVDEGKLRQVIINLLGNAVKFTDKGGIILRVSSTPGRRTRACWPLRWRTRGGASPRPSWTGSSSISSRAETGDRSEPGTGLGLAISRELIHLMGGEISATSQMGKGSLFRFVVPVSQCAESEVSAKEEARSVHGLVPGSPAYRILVVDDRPDNRAVLSGLMSSVGFATREAGNGAEALEEFASFEPHLVLMDIRMPGMDGYEATRRLRATPEGRKAKIIIVSASAFEANRQSALGAGADDFIAKPCRESELFEKVRKLLGAAYVYHETPVGPDGAAAMGPLSREDLASLPNWLKMELREATVRADFDRLLDLVVKTEECDAQVGRKLRHMAEQFMYRQIIDLLASDEVSLQ